MKPEERDNKILRLVQIAFPDALNSEKVPLRQLKPRDIEPLMDDYIRIHLSPEVSLEQSLPLPTGVRLDENYDGSRSLVFALVHSIPKEDIYQWLGHRAQLVAQTAQETAKIAQDSAVEANVLVQELEKELTGELPASTINTHSKTQPEQGRTRD